MSQTQFTRIGSTFLRQHPQYRSDLRGIYLGRLDTYPWIESYIQCEAPGHPRFHQAQSDLLLMNSIATDLLLDPDFTTTVLQPAFQNSCYQVSGITLEKVWYQKTSAGLVPPGGLLWIEFETLATCH